MKHPLALVASALVLGSLAHVAAIAQSPGERQPATSTPAAARPDAGRPVGSPAFVTVVPVAGGEATSVPIGGDGQFTLSGLAPGRYRLAITSRPAKQTQGATFGERVNAGIRSTGSAVADGSGAAAGRTRHDTVKNSISNVRAHDDGAAAQGGTGAPVAAGAGGKVKIDGNMPNRISMNVTIARLSRALELDGEAIEVEVGAGGVLTGRASAR